MLFRSRFPKARHDDLVDAISWLGIAYDNVQSAMTKAEEEEEEYIKETSEQQVGRNIFTGY